MSTDDWEHFTRLLYEYVETELDQFDHWRLEPAGWSSPVYVDIGMKLPPGHPEQAYDPLPRPGTRWGTGRLANASPEGVASREDLQRVIAELRADLTTRGWREWENPTLNRFLDALEAVLHDRAADRLASQAETEHDQPSWALIAAALIAATGYE